MPATDPEERRPEDLFPPSDLGAERAVLAGMMLSSEAIDTAFEELTGDEFYSPAHKALFEVMKRLYVKNKPLDANVIKVEAERMGKLEQFGGMEFLLELYNEVATGANISSYTAIVKERYVRRSVLEAVNGAVRDCHDNTYNTADILAGLESKLYKIGIDTHTEGLRSMAAGFKRSIENITEMRNAPDKRILGISSGINALDRKTMGWEANDFIIIAGRPSMGKTSFACHLMYQAAGQGKHVAFFSLESNEDTIDRNMLSMVGGVDSVKTRLGDVNEIEYDRLVEAAGELYELPLAIDDCGSMTVHELRSRIMRFARKNPMDIVFIDYLQFIRGSDMRMQRKDQVSEISKVLKGMAKDLDMPVVALAQLNRNPTDRRDHTPVISDLKESGEIEQDADIVLMLHRPDYYDEHDRPDELDVIIGKNRNGPTGPVRMFYNRSTSHFGELER